MKDVFIINAGGFGRTFASLCQADAAHGKEWVLRGFLDDRSNLPATPDLPIVGSPHTYVAQPGQMFICALGNPALRKQYAAPLLAQGADFSSVRPYLHLAMGSSFGYGCVFELNTMVGADSQIGNFVLMLANSVVGHDVEIGDYTTIDSFCFIGGGARIGSGVAVHTHATILPGVTVGDGAVIGAGAVVVRSVKPGTTVIGNPAKPFNFR